MVAALRIDTKQDGDQNSSLTVVFDTHILYIYLEQPKAFFFAFF